MMEDVSSYDAGYLVDEASDDDDDNESGTSSEDDVQTFLKKMCRGDKSDSDSDSDDFEKEMNKELDSHVEKLKNLHKASSQAKPAASKPAQTEQKYYDDDYFSSGSDDEGDSASKKPREKHPVLSNDELLYDPDMDDQDQKWVDDRRRHYFGQKPATEQSQEGGLKPLPNSDAVLNCPCCMSVLTMDCQRHEVYKTQYRAMFVMNCNVDYSEELVYKSKKKRTKKGHRSENFTASSSSADEIYRPVRCSICNTEVGVYDDEEVYHFFNVLAGFT